MRLYGLVFLVWQVKRHNGRTRRHTSQFSLFFNWHCQLNVKTTHSCSKKNSCSFCSFMNRCIFATCTPSDYLEEGVCQRFSMKLTMPFADSVNLPHKYWGTSGMRGQVFLSSITREKRAERAGSVRDYEEIRLAGGGKCQDWRYGYSCVAPAGLSTIGRWPGYDTVLAQVRSAALV